MKYLEFLEVTEAPPVEVEAFLDRLAEITQTCVMTEQLFTFAVLEMRMSPEDSWPARLWGEFAGHVWGEVVAIAGGRLVDEADTWLRETSDGQG